MSTGLTKNNLVRQGVLFRYADRLPVTEATPFFSLGEGDTPLVKSRRIVLEVGCEALYLKLEGCNPTGSFKDRGMVVAVAKAYEEGKRAIMCASTGNTSASAAAYAAYLGMSCYVVIPMGNIASGKLAQAIAYGSTILAISGNFDDALRLVRELTRKHDIALVNSVNPHRIEGQKTAAFEIVDALGDAPDYVSLPVGNAGNITAYWKGFCEYAEFGRATRHPQMLGFQAEGAAPLVSGEPVEEPNTIATAIRIGRPATWAGAITARDESGGSIQAVSDDEIVEAYRMLAREEGVFGEPASAAPIAGLLKRARAGENFAGKIIVSIVTGNGLKDVDNAMKIPPQIFELPPDGAEIERALGWT
ncbi:MAG TPA: threonine synthase [Dehalococcoidia bacterium]